MGKKSFFLFMASLGAAALLSACSGSDDSGNTGSATYTIGGTISGLADGNHVVLQNNGENNLAVNADGSFTFSTALNNRSSYEVTVLAQPTNPDQICTVTHGSGRLAGANVTDVNVNCVSTHTIGGTISGLSGSGLILQNNAGDNLPVSANGGFTFETALTDESGYEVTILTQPTSPNQLCTVTSGSGILAGNDITEVAISCSNTYTIGGTLSGLPSGASVTLQNNGSDDLPLTVNGPFTFNNALVNGGSYEVSVLTQPNGYYCTVNNGFGTLDSSDVINVDVSCGIYMDSGQTLGDFGESSIAMGDINGDGYIDMLAGNRYNIDGVQQGIRVYINDGTGNFIDSGQTLGGYSTNSLALGDVDGDGDLDLVEGSDAVDDMFNILGNPNTLYINDGNGSFTDSGQTLGNSITKSVALGDLDGDKDLDIITGNLQGANQVYFNNGNGSFTNSGQDLGNNDTASITLGDVDGDGDLDLVTGNEYLDWVAYEITGSPNKLYLNDGTGSFSDSGQALGNYATNATAFGDVDGDGDLDLVTGNKNNEPNRIYFNDGSGIFNDSGQTLGTYTSFSIALGDVDGDGDLDLAIGNFETITGYGAANQIYLNNSTGNFTDSGLSLGNYMTAAVVLCDVNGDSDLDLVTGDMDKGINVYINLTN